MSVFQINDVFETINIASGIPITIREILDIIINLNGNNFTKIKYDSSKPTMLPKRLISIDKIKKKCNWQPKISMSQGLKLTINWYKKFYKDTNPEKKYDNI